MSLPDIAKRIYDENKEKSASRVPGFDANTQTYYKAEIRGVKCLFTPLRLKDYTIPDKFYHYNLKHDANGNWGPIKIDKTIYSDFFGTIISEEEIKIGDLKSDEWKISGRYSEPVRL